METKRRVILRVPDPELVALRAAKLAAATAQTKPSPSRPRQTKRRGELSPAQRSLQARMAVHRSWAFTPDRQARTAPARAAADARFERMVDPDGVLPEMERRLRADSARKAYFAELGMKSVKARQRASARRKRA